jgi:protein disulfide-isomerase A6
VKGFPTIKLFRGGAGKSHADGEDYKGGREASGIVEALLAEVDRTGVPKELPELVSAEVLKDNCSGNNHICVIAAFPHILDSGASGRNKYKELVSTVSKTFGASFSFLWFEGTSQPDLEQALE